MSIEPPRAREACGTTMMNIGQTVTERARQAIVDTIGLLFPRNAVFQAEHDRLTIHWRSADVDRSASLLIGAPTLAQIAGKDETQARDARNRVWWQVDEALRSQTAVGEPLIVRL